MPDTVPAQGTEGGAPGIPPLAARFDFWMTVGAVLLVVGAEVSGELGYRHAVTGDPLLQPTAACATGLLLLLGRPALPGVVLAFAILLARSLPDGFQDVLLRSILPTLIATWLLRRWRTTRRFEELPSLVRFVALGVVIPGLLGSVLEGLIGWLTHQPLRLNALLADALSRMSGMGLLLPMVMLLVHEVRQERAGLRLSHGSAVAGALVSSALVAIPFPESLALLALPGLLLPILCGAVVVVTVGPSVAHMFVTSFGLCVIGLTSAGRGPFALQDAAATLLTLHGYLTVLALGTLALSCFDARRRQAQLVSKAALRGAGVSYFSFHPDSGIRILDSRWRRALGHNSSAPIPVPAFLAMLRPEDTAPAWLAGGQPVVDHKACEFRVWTSMGDWRWCSCVLLGTENLDLPEGATAHGLLQDIDVLRSNEETRTRLILREAELRSLKLRINPHFLFNAFTTLLSLIPASPRLAGKVTLDLAQLLRSSLADAAEDTVPLQREMETMMAYLRVEHARFGERMDFSVSMEYAVRRVPFPPMLLQTLAENAVKYGVSRRLEPTFIQVVLRKSERGLWIEIVNDGKIVTPRVTDASLGSGLASTKARLRLCFGEDARFSLEERSEGQVAAIIDVATELPDRDAHGPTFFHSTRSTKPTESGEKTDEDEDEE